MNEKELEIKIENFLDSILLDKEIFNEISFLQKELGISRKQIIASWLFWDTGIRKYSNEVYASEPLRLVMHLHNQLAHSWHVTRQEIVLRYLKIANPKFICEIGFGVPQKYVKSLLHTEALIFLGDYEPSSLTFAKKLLEYWNKDWQEKITLKMFDLNKNVLPQEYDVYIFQDSIEHASNPTETLSQYVASVPPNTHFIFSLPIEIENPIPEHHIVWKNEKAIFDWLQTSGLNIVEHETVRMNRDIDIFSFLFHPEFREVVILARKS